MVKVREGGRGGRGGCGAKLLAALHTFGQSVRAQGNRDGFTRAESRGLRRRSAGGVTEDGVVVRRQFVPAYHPLAERP